MIDITSHPLYKEDIANSIQSFPFECLAGKTVLVTGTTGLIGHFLVDVLMGINSQKKANVKVIASGRNKDRLASFFDCYLSNPDFRILQQDVREPFALEDSVDYVVHCACNAHPLAYAKDPVGIMTTNFIGTLNVLNLCREKSAELIYISTFCVYGKNRGDVTSFNEDYTGLLKVESRSCYPESKRSSETLCKCYYEQYGVRSKIIRMCRVFGPTMIDEDSKASAQFLKNALMGHDIVLKSDGKQFYTYIYTPDAVSAILYILTKGAVNEIYNVGNQNGNVHLGDFAKKIADYAGTKVVYDVQGAEEHKGSMNSVYDIMDYSRLSSIGWSPIYDLDEAVKRTLEILKSTKQYTDKIPFLK